MLTWSPQGLHCPIGGFHIDPHRPVPLALVTHAHSDHARRGSQMYVCARSGAGLLRRRIGQKAVIREVDFGEPLFLGEVKVSFHPAGHILGSAQIRVEHRGEVWVASGDYKRDPDPSCEPFEVVPCDTFVTEATFGTPRYRWGDTSGVVGEIAQWWDENRREGRCSALVAYSLGKTQRVLSLLAKHGGVEGPVLLYGEAAPLTECYRAEGVPLIETVDLASLPKGERVQGRLIVGPSSMLESPEFTERVGENYSSAFASGWAKLGYAQPRGTMIGGGRWGRGSYDRGFVMSDHADWPGLLRTIEETGARRVLTLHGGEGSLVRHLRKQGLDAAPMSAEAAARPPRPMQLSLL